MSDSHWNPPGVTERDSRNQRIRAAIFAVMALVLIWQVTSRSFESYLARVAPDMALHLRPDDPVALLNLADRALIARQAEQQKKAEASVGVDPNPGNSAQASQDQRNRVGGLAKLATEAPSEAPQSANPVPSDLPTDDQIRAWAELALANDPLNARALRILGQLADGESDEAQTANLMQAAARRSLRESAALYWLMRKRFAEQDYASTVFYADALMRGRQRLARFVLTTLAQIAESRSGSSEVKKVLATNPPWRSEFFTVLPNSVVDARTPLDMLFSIRDTPDPPTVSDLRPYINFLIRRKLYELAYYTWLQFLPADQLNNVGHLFNGSFEVAPSGLPFDWIIESGAGVTVDIAPKPEQVTEHALSIEFGYGRVEFGGVTQLLLLAPGSYHFSGKYKGQMKGKRGLSWRVSCAEEGGALIGQSAMFIGVAPAWKDFEFSFAVPESGCALQQLRLQLEARTASEQLVSGSAWYDELRISRPAEIRNIRKIKN